MKVGVTINIGNYESFKVEGNEYESLNECMAELDATLSMINDASVQRFRERKIFDLSR